MTFDMQPWQLMWLMAFAIYALLKGLTYIGHPPASLGRRLAYLFFWPGMDARAFLASSSTYINYREFDFAGFKTMMGAMLLIIAPSIQPPLLAGWLGMIGLIFTLHFGLFHMLSLFWRSYGMHAEPIMQFPILSTSLSDFWGKRWNLAFRDLAFGYLFRPLVRRIGTMGATMTVFLVSGLIHDLVISGPVGTGFGGPTLYFVLQGVGLILEKRYVPGWLGRAFCFLIVVGPLPLLFHQAFVLQIILPTVYFLHGQTDLH